MEWSQLKAFAARRCVQHSKPHPVQKAHLQSRCSSLTCTCPGVETSSRSARPQSPQPDQSQFAQTSPRLRENEAWHEVHFEGIVAGHPNTRCWGSIGLEAVGCCPPTDFRSPGPGRTPQAVSRVGPRLCLEPGFLTAFGSPCAMLQALDLRSVRCANNVALLRTSDVCGFLPLLVSIHESGAFSVRRTHCAPEVFKERWLPRYTPVVARREGNFLCARARCVRDLTWRLSRSLASGEGTTRPFERQVRPSFEVNSLPRDYEPQFPQGDLRPLAAGALDRIPSA